MWRCAGRPAARAAAAVLRRAPPLRRAPARVRAAGASHSAATPTASAPPDAAGLPDAAAKPASEWDAKGLVQEAARQVYRAEKRLFKAAASKRQADERYAAVEALGDAATLKQLESVPDVDAAAARVSDARQKLEALRDLEAAARACAGEGVSDEVAAAALALGVGDAPPPKQPRGPKRKKGPPASSVAPRKPYWRYTSADGVEIRVGRRAADNDELSCDPAHRDAADWWLHAAGCPGSHVVIRTHADDVPKETLADAAALAAKNSKARQRGKAPVTLCRCRQVSKPRGAKAGLVQLSGDVRTVKSDVSAEGARLERLEATKQ